MPSAFQGRIGRTIAESTPHWPAEPTAPAGAPNILVVLFDDTGFSDFGCYGSPIETPTIDRLAAGGLRYTGLHTTAMCSTTRAAMLTGRNPHSVGVGSLANFDSGYPGYRGKIRREAGTIAEILRPHGYRTYMVGKWHVTPLTESGATGPFDGWPLGRGFDRYYGFMGHGTDQYAPELFLDNAAIAAPGNYESGYHLTADLVDRSIQFLAGHVAERPGKPWLLWLALGATHSPHQAPRDIILGYEDVFARGWDVERERRLARQVELGIVPAHTRVPPRNDGVKPWDEHTPDERRFFLRLQSAFAGMLDHADRQLARLVAFLERAALVDDTIILVLSDNGASQEGGLLGSITTGPRPVPWPERLARLEDIGGPKLNNNFPHGWAMAANTPLRRYKQNTHGGGIRDPFVVSWPKGVAARGGLRHQFCHVSDILPTLLDVVGIAPPDEINGIRQMPLEGTSFKPSLADPTAPSKAEPQYFEQFGHRGLWHQGWKAVAYHPTGTPFDADRWELYRLDEDFNETNDLAAAEPDRLRDMIELWWRLAERHDVLPLDDRFGPRFAENAARFHGPRTHYVMHAGMGHVPSEVAPDVRSRSYLIEAFVELDGGDRGVLIAHGDMTTGYSLYLQDGRLVHDWNVGGEHVIVRSDTALPAAGAHRLGVRVRRLAAAEQPTTAVTSEITLVIDGAPAGCVETKLGFAGGVSWSGLDIGRDPGSPVSHYAAPFAFTGRLLRVEVTMDVDQRLDGDVVGRAIVANE
ncbi:MAG TPA: arylsulfatase [Candidatus Sulfotelmatobacter sp.]|nr:arylsulfatase [Candidatus Sulfotelmatobacter sp.]